MHTAEIATLATEASYGDVFGSGPVREPLPTLTVAGLVAAGGAVGAVLRFVLQALLPSTTTLTLVEVPWATLLANTLGCLGIGVLAGALEVRPGLPRWMQPLLGTGLLAGFTTFSAVVLEGSAMIGAAFPTLALGYAALTLLTAFAGVVAGLLLGRRLARPRAGEEEMV